MTEIPKEDMLKAEEKVKELLKLMLESNPIDRKVVNWETLTYYRLQALKSFTWQNAVRLAILNKAMKEKPKDDPAFPQEVIDFLKPAIVV